MGDIHFSIALEKGSNNLVNATDVKNGKECNCYCASCGEDLVAVNKGIVQRPHFRHNKESECPFSQSYESYIHWLAKAVILNLDTIQLPPIYIADLNFYKELHKQLVNKVKNLLKTHGLLKDFDEDKIHFYDLLLQPARVIDIQDCSLEKLYQTKLGNIVVDAVLKTGNHYLFIEPFYTNPVTTSKLEKLKEIEVSTISIDLVEFINRHNFYFSKEVFTEYIKSDIKSKKWIFIRKSKVDQLIDKLFTSKVERNISLLKQRMPENEAIKEQIDTMTNDLNILDQQYYVSRKKIIDNIEKLQNQLYLVKPSDLFN